MFMIDVVLEFLMHGSNELGPIRLSKSLMEEHGIRIGAKKRDNMIRN